jgi:hypothetical protein
LALWLVSFGFLDSGPNFYLSTFWLFGSLALWLFTFGFWVLGFGFWVLGFGFWVLGFGFLLLALGFWLLAFGFWLLALFKGTIHQVSIVSITIVSKHQKLLKNFLIIIWVRCPLSQEFSGLFTLGFLAKAPQQSPPLSIYL